MNDSNGDWSALANWNSGQTPVLPTPGAGQVAPVGTLTLPTPRLPGAAGTGVTSGQHDTVILDRPNADVTVTLSAGSHNVRKLLVREKLNLTGGSLSASFDPATWDSPLASSLPVSAQFSEAVSLANSASLSVHTLQVDAARTFTVEGGSLTLNRLNLMPGPTPATLLVNGNVNLNPLNDAAAVIANGAGAGSSGLVNLGGGNRLFNVANGAAAVDLSVNVPVTNGGLTKLGAGTLALNGANTYAGDTFIQAGKLLLGSPTLADMSDIYLTTGATLDLNLAGGSDAVRGLIFDGVPQAPGVWGPVGSGAQFTSPFLTGTGFLSVAVAVPPLPPGPAGNVIDDFEIDEGHFNWNYNLSPISQTFGLASGPANASGPTDRTTAEHQGAGVASQLLDLVVDATGDDTWQLRHNSGITSAAQPAGNVAVPGTGYVGFWLKTDDAGATVRIAIDDPVPAGATAIEMGTSLNVIADNQWHLYQWNFEDASHWDAFGNAGSDGDIDATSGTVTIDSIWFTGIGNTQIYLDNVMHNPNGLITPGYIPGDFDGDGLVNSADYGAWRVSFGATVTPWTGADGNGDGTVDVADYVMWRQIALASGAELTSASAVPEPAGLVVFALAAGFVILVRQRLIR
jgi:autotransporter-associated beta strand protein